MEIKNIQLAFVAISLWLALGLGACQTSTVTESTTEPEITDNTAVKSLSPNRVDIRGSIIRDRYYQGQVTIEVEGVPTRDTRYSRAVVLVLPTTQIVGLGGKPAGMVDLRQGQHVSILLRSGGRGNQEGVGIARKIWLEEF